MVTKDSIEFGVRLFQALLTPMIGINTMFIAYQQYRIAQAKRQQDYYERCVPIYKATLEYIKSAGSGRPSREVFDKFTSETAEAVFLLQPKVNAYLNELHGKGLDIFIANDAVPPDVPVVLDDLRKDMLKRRAEAVMWFRAQLDGAAKIFADDLAFIRDTNHGLHKYSRR